MSETCTCAKSIDTPQPFVNGGQCPACGKELVEVSPGINAREFAMSCLRILAGVVFVIALVGGLLLLIVDTPRIQAQNDVANAQINGPLTKAVQAYARDHNGTFPPSLQALLQKENGGSYLENLDGLIDPWGKAYQYDAKGPRNKGAKPDIWTDTPDGKVIGNWPAAR